MARSALSVILFVAGVAGILPSNFGFGDEFENEITNMENSPVFENVDPEVTRVVKNAHEGLSIDELTNKLQAKVNAVSRERSSGGVPAKSIRELEDLMMHPTWLTNSSNGNPQERVISKNRRMYIKPPTEERNWYPQTDTAQSDHIREIITKFHELRPKEPITDNRITKFVFTHDADLATSRSVQQHNREVEAAFADFNKKLQETLTAKTKKIESDKPVEKEMSDRSFNRVVNFLDKNIQKLKTGVPHKQVCRKHKSHSKDSTQDRDFAEDMKRMGDVDCLKRTGMLRFDELAQTRDGLENVLLGLDRPRGPVKRHLPKFLKHRRENPANPRPKRVYKS